MTRLTLPSLGIILGMFSITSGCASGTIVMEPAPAPRPMMASLQPVATPAPAPTPAPTPVERHLSAASLLDRGIRHLGDGDFSEAAEAFGEAVVTGRLNNAGRVFAYWQIFVAMDELGDEDRSSDALAAFVVVADEVLAERDDLRYAVNEAGDFVARFELPAKLRRARASLSAAWSRRADHFGRTAQLPVPVRDLSEMEQFLAMVAACEDMARETRDHREIFNDSGERVRQVTITCGDFERTAEYYFALVARAP